MNKNDLIGVVADKAKVTKAQAGEAVDAVFEAITGSLKKDDVFTLGTAGGLVTHEADPLQRPLIGNHVGAPLDLKVALCAFA